MPNGDTGECCDIAPEIGITGTPVIDPATGTLYVVAKTKEVRRPLLRAAAARARHRDRRGEVRRTGRDPGQRARNGNRIGWRHSCRSIRLRENERTALLLNNGVVYFGFGSHGDNQPYHGWLLGYNATTLQRVVAFSSTPNGEGGGIWQSGGGLAIDSAGNFYFATGDGDVRRQHRRHRLRRQLPEVQPDHGRFSTTSRRTIRAVSTRTTSTSTPAA